MSALLILPNSVHAQDVPADPPAALVVDVRSAPYGCRGDGATNDTACFQRAAKAIRDAGGGTLVIPPGTYLVGQQQFAAAPGLGYSYRGVDTTGTGHRNVLDIAGTTQPVTIIGTGAKLQWAPGLKYGFFNPVTGQPEAAASGNAAQPAGMPGIEMGAGMIVIRDTTAPVTIEGLELDGNVSRFIFNEKVEIQLWAVNLLSVNNQQVTVRNVYTHHSPHDGLYVGYSGRKASDPDTPTLLENVRSEYNSRLDLGWTGGNGLTAIGCTFAFAGSNGFITTGPASNVDIEGEFSVSLARGRFINCHFIHVAPAPALYNGWNVVAVTGASSDVVFEGCTFENYSNDAVVVDRLRYTFVNSRFHGRVSAGLGDGIGATAADTAVAFHDSYFDDRAHPVYGAPYGDFLFRTDSEKGAGGVVIEGCTFVTSSRQSILLSVRGAGGFAAVRNSRFHHLGSPGSAVQQHATFENVILQNVGFSDRGVSDGPYAPLQGMNIAGGQVRVLGSSVISGAGAAAGE